MSKILILSPTLPYPARENGLSIRLAPLIEKIGQHYETHLIVAGEARTEFGQAIHAAKQACASVTIIPNSQTRLHTRIGLLKSIGIRPRAPFRILRDFTHRLVKESVDLLGKGEDYRILAFGDSHSHALCSLIRRYPKAPSAIDWVDSPALHIKRSIEIGEEIDHADLDALAKWERYVNAVVDRVIYISRPDATYANSDFLTNINIIPNGVFDEENECERHDWRRAMDALPTLTIGFLGNMGYPPNHLAALRLIEDVLPCLQLRMPDLEIKAKIIGRHPLPHLLSHQSPTIRVTGAVESIWPEMEEVDVFVFPMTRGAGLQNKVLEALRARRPVIASAICAASLPDEYEHGVVVADGPDEIAKKLSVMVSDRRMLQGLVDKGTAYTNDLKSERMVERYMSCLNSL